MADERFKPDPNRKAAGVVGGYASTDAVGAATPTIVAIRVNATTGRLLVDVNGPSTGVVDGEAVDAGDLGTLMLGTDGANYQVLSTDASGNLQVDIVSGGTGSTQYAEDAVHNSGDTGTMALAVRNDTLAALAADGDYTPFQTDPDGALWTHQKNNVVDSGNSTTTPLAGDATFTGTGVDTLSYGAVSIQLDASHDSATDGMTFQWSTDNSNWDDVYTFTYTAANGARRFQFGTSARYFRVVFTNGSTIQTHVRIQTILHHVLQPITSIHRLVDDMSPDRSAEVVKSVVFAQAAGSGDFKPVQSTAAGNFKVSIQEISDGLDVGAGAVGSETQRMTLASDDPAVTALQVIDDWDNTASDGASVSGDVAHDSPDAGEPVKIGGRAQEPTAALEEVADNDRVDATFDRQGRLATWNGYPVESADINDAVSGNNTIVAAKGAGIRIAVIGCMIISDGTTDVRWEDGAGGTAFTGQMPLQAREGFVLPIGNQPWFVGSAATLLNLELTAAVNVHGIVSYVSMTD